MYPVILDIETCHFQKYAHIPKAAIKPEMARVPCIGVKSVEEEKLFIVRSEKRILSTFLKWLNQKPVSKCAASVGNGESVLPLR